MRRKADVQIGSLDFLMVFQTHWLPVKEIICPMGDEFETFWDL